MNKATSISVVLVILGVTAFAYVRLRSYAEDRKQSLVVARLDAVEKNEERVKLERAARANVYLLLGRCADRRIPRSKLPDSLFVFADFSPEEYDRRITR